MSNPAEPCLSAGTKGDFSASNLERNKSPNRLAVDGVINNGKNSAVSLHAETTEKLHFSHGDTVLIEDKKREGMNCIALDGDTCHDVKDKKSMQILPIDGTAEEVNENLYDSYLKLFCSNTSGGVSQSTPRRPKADVFACAVSRMAVAQMCETVGFNGLKESALDALTDVAIRYLLDLGKTSASLASLSGRTECNLFDIIRGFEDLEAPRGFSSTPKSGNSVINSSAIKELIDFVVSSEEIPFVQPVPSFPVVREVKLIPSFIDMNETPAGKHIPPWLPAFPDPHTYVQTPMWNERTVNLRAEKIEQARQRRKAERALLSLQQRLLSSVPSRDNSNPILSKPCQPGEKDVSKVNLVKDSISLMDAFGPSIETVKEGELGDDVESEGKLVPERRPNVIFRLKSGKKLLSEPVEASVARKGGGRVGHLLGREDERDDKKRRAEYIIRHSMENPQELTQL